MKRPRSGRNSISKPPRRPAVSVVMPVHNALPHLDEAIESILGQSFTDFEFVILDDGSTDGSRERLREWAARDSRIRLMEEKRNLGPALSSDRVARAASAPIVARMDADDVSYPTRLAEQLDVFDHHPEVGVVGGLYDIIDSNGRKVRGAETWRLSQSASVPPFGNGPLMYRREVFEAAGGYRKECEFWEDHDLIIRMSANSNVMVIPHSIYKVRQSRVGTRFASEQARVERAVDLMYRCRARVDRKEPYDDLLRSPADDSRKVDPRVFISLGSVVLWAGETPRFFRRILRRARLSPDFRTFSALVWTAWASTSPATLKAFLRTLSLLRNSLHPLAADKPVVWAASANAPVLASRPGLEHEDRP